MEKNNKGLVLVVDDEPKNIKLLGKTLREEGYEISIASNGKEALLVAKRALPEIILLDVMMPEMDGFQACEELKKDPDLKRIPVIFLTARGDAKSITKGFDIGAVDYMTKPIHASEVLARIKTHLELKHYRENLEKDNHQKKELLHLLCHDLTGSIGFIQTRILVNRAKGVTTRESDLERFEKCITESLDLIDVIKNYLAIETGKLSLELKNYSLSTLIEDSFNLVFDRFNKKEISIKREIPSNIEIFADKAVFIHTIMGNLLSNALKFSKRGSTVNISAIKEKGKVILTVKDQGRGLSPEKLKLIFNINQDTTSVGTEQEKGIGFGMPLLKSFVEKLEGNIKIESRCEETNSEDHGTKVILTFPEATS